MNKKLLLFFFLLPVFVGAQNLVPNPSFEDTISCYIDIDSVKFWHNPTGYSPDYFNSHMQSILPYSDFKVPLNLYGYQTAKTGVGYVGIITAFIGANDREYIQSELLDTLIAGQKYFVSFYVCIPDSSPYSSNDIGAFFSDTAISSSNFLYLPYNPQVSNNSFSNPIDIFNSWILVKDSFIASGGEKYITIGNFKNDVNTDTINFNYNSLIQPFGYSYIDDIRVSVSDSISNGIQSVTNSSVMVFNTPEGNLFISSLESPLELTRIFNISGELIYSKIEKQITDYIDTDNFSSGLYFLIIKTNQTTIHEKIIVIK